MISAVNCHSIFVAVFSGNNFEHFHLTANPEHKIGDDAFFEGHAIHKGNLVLAGDPTVADLLGAFDPTQPARGNFTIFRRHADRIEIGTDWLGLSQLYLYNKGGTVVVSNNLEAAREAVINATASTLPISWPALHRIAVLETPFWHDTPYEYISCVPFDGYLRIDRSGVHVNRRGDVSQLSKHRGEEAYKRAIELATEEIAENTRAIVKRFGGPRPVVMSLSGGVDSRIVLASLIGTGHSKDVGYWTYGAGEDGKAAASLRKLFGLRFHRIERSAHQPIAKGFEGAFSAISGQRVMTVLPFIEPTLRPEVIINGGCGETFRGFYSTMLDSYRVPAEVDPAEGLLASWEKRRDWSALSPDAAEGVKRAFLDEYNAITVGPPLTRLDLLYPLHRNRFHFGLGARVRSRIMLTFCPLNSPAAFVASLLLDPAERAKGRVAYDIIGALAPELRDYQINGKSWSPLFSTAPSSILPDAIMDEEAGDPFKFRGKASERAPALALRLLNQIVRPYPDLASQLKQNGLRLPVLRERLEIWSTEGVRVSKGLRYAQLFRSILAANGVTPFG